MNATAALPRPSRARTWAGASGTPGPARCRWSRTRRQPVHQSPRSFRPRIGGVCCQAGPRGSPRSSWARAAVALRQTWVRPSRRPVHRHHPQPAGRQRGRPRAQGRQRPEPRLQRERPFGDDPVGGPGVQPGDRLGLGLGEQAAASTSRRDRRSGRAPAAPPPAARCRAGRTGCPAAAPPEPCAEDRGDAFRMARSGAGSGGLAGSPAAAAAASTSASGRRAARPRDPAGAGPRAAPRPAG